jgi:hypothetical protein
MNEDVIAPLIVFIVIFTLIGGLVVYSELRDDRDLDLKCVPMGLSEDNTKVHIICSARDVVFFNDTVVFNKE